MRARRLRGWAVALIIVWGVVIVATTVTLFLGNDKWVAATTIVVGVINIGAFVLAMRKGLKDTAPDRDGRGG